MGTLLSDKPSFKPVSEMTADEIAEYNYRQAAKKEHRASWGVMKIGDMKTPHLIATIKRLKQCYYSAYRAADYETVLNWRERKASR